MWDFASHAFLTFIQFIDPLQECICHAFRVSRSTGCLAVCRYVLKSQMKELLELEAKNAISIEEEIENERKKVDAKTPITEEVMLQLASAPLETDPHESC